MHKLAASVGSGAGWYDELDMRVVIDNQAVRNMAEKFIGGDAAVPRGCGFGRWARMRDAIRQSSGIQTAWIPSHGKRMESWKPPEDWPLSAQYWRLLSDEADEAATRAIVDRKKWLERSSDGGRNKS